jgi:hypothetical protein
MNEDVLNQQIRRFLKKVGINSQREIEQAVRAAEQQGALGETRALGAVMTLEVPALGLHLRVDGDIGLD